MSRVKWRVFLLFVLITLSIFFSMIANSDRFMEFGGNGTFTPTGAGVLREDLITNLTNRLEVGDHEAKLNAAAELGRFGETAADVLIEKIESNTSSSGEVNSYMLLALLETGDSRTETVLSESFKKIQESNKVTNEITAEEQAENEISVDILQSIEEKDRAMRRNLAISLDRDYNDETNSLEAALRAEEQNSSIYDSFALSEFEPDEPGDETEKLIKALKSDSGGIRIAALMALGERKEAAAIDSITPILTRDYSPVQSSAAYALGEIGDERAVEVLIKQMKDGSDSVRSNSAIALGKIGKETAVPDLIQRLRDNRAVVRSSAALALGKIGSEAAIEPLIEVLNSGKLIDGRAKDSVNANEDIRKSAILALGEIGGPGVTKALTDILVDKEEKLSVRMAAAAALGNTGDPQAMETLKNVFNDRNMDANLRNQAFLALGKTRNQEAAELFVGKLGDREFRDSARKALSEMGEVAVDPLIENLKTTDRRARDETALLLIEIGDPKAVNPLIEAYQ